MKKEYVIRKNSITGDYWVDEYVNGDCVIGIEKKSLKEAREWIEWQKSMDCQQADYWDSKNWEVVERV